MSHDRYEQARRYFREHHSGIEPDEQFAQRVVARLPKHSDAAFGWAVARVLPATLALLLVLIWVSWQVTPAPSGVQEPSPTEDVLTWALDAGGEGP